MRIPWKCSTLTQSMLALGHGGQGRRHVLPQLPGAADEEVGLRLAQVHLLQDGDLLGDEAAPMGSQCESDTAYCLPSMTPFQIPNQPN